MLNDLLSPVGETNPEDFMYGAYALIMAAAVMHAMQWNVTPGPMMMISKIMGLVFFYSWIVLFVKRYRHGGESGWKVLIPGIVFSVLMGIATVILIFTFSGDVMSQALQDMQQAQQSGMSDAAVQAQMETKYGQAFMDSLGMPYLITYALLSYLVAAGFNGVIPKGSTSQQTSRVAAYL